MKWRKSRGALILECRDLKILARCGMTLPVIPRYNHRDERVPPLWSVLSYILLQCDSDEAHIRYRYRTLQEMASDTSRWYHTRYLPKSGGGTRKISVPDDRLRTQQRFILKTILREIPVSDHAFAYQKGRNMVDCAKPHENQDLLIHLDIMDFFGSVTEEMVFGAFLRNTGYPKSLCRFLARMCCLRGKLPQGTCTSPMLSNIVFRLCDEQLAHLAGQHNLQYTRYSDDLFFSGADAVPVGEFLRQVREILLLNGFRINEEKTQIRRRQHRQTVLGLTVNDRIQVSRDYRRKLKQELYYLERFGENCKGAVECGDYLRYLQQLQGKLAHVLHVDPDNEELWYAHLKLTLRIHHHNGLLARGK